MSFMQLWAVGVQDVILTQSPTPPQKIRKKWRFEEFRKRIKKKNSEKELKKRIQ
jgi:hypothetical protein